MPPATKKTAKKTPVTAKQGLKSISDDPAASKSPPTRKKPGRNEPARVSKTSRASARRPAAKTSKAPKISAAEDEDSDDDQDALNIDFETGEDDSSRQFIGEEEDDDVEETEHIEAAAVDEAETDTSVVQKSLKTIAKAKQAPASTPAVTTVIKRTCCILIVSGTFS